MTRQAPFSGALQELAGKINRIFGVGQTFSGKVDFAVGVGAIDGAGVPWDLTQNTQSILTDPVAQTAMALTPELPPGTYDILLLLSTDIQTGPRRWDFRISDPTGDTIHRISWENSVAGVNVVFPFTAAILKPSTLDLNNVILANGTVSARIYWKKRILDT